MKIELLSQWKLEAEFRNLSKPGSSCEYNIWPVFAHDISAVFVYDISLAPKRRQFYQTRYICIIFGYDILPVFSCDIWAVFSYDIWQVIKYDISAVFEYDIWLAANKGGNFRKRGAAPISRGADSELPPMP